MKNTFTRYGLWACGMVRRLSPMWYSHAFLLIFLVQQSHGQTIQLSALVDQTVGGTEYGLEIGTIRSNGWGLKAFYQFSQNQTGHEVSTARNELTGIIIQTPLKKCKEMGFFLNTKLALANQKFLVIIPELLTQIQMTKHVNLGLRTGFRKGHAAIGLQLGIQI